MAKKKSKVPLTKEQETEEKLLELFEIINDIAEDIYIDSYEHYASISVELAKKIKMLPYSLSKPIDEWEL